MYTDIITVSIAVAAVLYWQLSCRKGMNSWLAIVPSLGLACGVGQVCGLFLALVIGTAVPHIEVVRGPVQLAAMQIDSGTGGAFLTWRGTSGRIGSYKFMALQEDGSMVPYSVPADSRLHIFEDAALSQTGTWTSTVLVADTSSWLYPWAFLADRQTVVLRTDLRIPVGSVAHQFEALQ